jgi:MATE family multidrug resistance protein
MTELSPASPALSALPAARPRGGMRQLVELAVPLVLAQLSQTLMGIVDSAFVGRLGAAELGAVAFANIWLWTIFSLFFGAASVVQTFVAQAHGAGDERRCGHWAWQGLWTVAPTTALAGLAAYFLASFALSHVGNAPELVAPSIAYVQPAAVGMSFLGVVFVWNGFFRGIGNMRTPLIVGVIANLANVIGDYALIFGNLGAPRLGVAGAAIATAASQLLFAVLLIAAAARRGVAARFDTRPRRPEPAAIARLLRTGLPIGGQWVFDAASFALFTLILASLGAASVAASHSFIMLVNVSFMIALGVSGATQTLVGRAIGARQPELAVAALKNGLCVALAVSFALAIALTALPELLIRIFTSDPSVLALGVSVLRLGAVFQLCDAAHIVVAGALRGAGDTRWPFLWQTALAWGVFVPLAWLLGVKLGYGLDGAYAGGVLYVALLAGGLLWRFRSGRWRSIHI